MLGPEVGQARGLDHGVGHVDPEAIHASIEPEREDRLEFRPNRRVVPVQVRLFGGEDVQVPLARSPVGLEDPAPCRPTEHARPVVRRLVAICTQAFGEVVARPGRRPRIAGERLLKPAMSIRRVIRHDVDQHSKPERMGIGQQSVGVVERPEHGIHGPVVGHVVAAIGHRRDVPGGDPQGIDAEVPEIGESLPDAGDIADPVAIAIGETADVDLVDHGVPTPGRGTGSFDGRIGHAGSRVIGRQRRW